MKIINKIIRLNKDETIDEHRLIMVCYLGRMLTSDELVHHKDCDPLNNNIENLEIVNRSEHAKIHFTYGRKLSKKTKAIISIALQGSKAPMAKLNEQKVIAIRELLNKDYTLRGIAAIYGVSARTILRIKQRETWKHI